MRVGRDWLGGSCVVRFVSIGVTSFFFAKWSWRTHSGGCLTDSEVPSEFHFEEVELLVLSCWKSCRKVLTNILEVELVNIGLVLDSLQA